ncbi:DUF402 domain-containing protein [Paenibacillus yanchengensis]|uniref:DUF402 domain-containing protein n=1 Tax=Paenibacillus yanchengensis TaxID=2035833 RepID=A0ABW4YJF4_9BACL
MKRKFSDRANWRRIINRTFRCEAYRDKHIRGLVTVYYIHEMRDPLWRKYEDRKLCLADQNYVWLQHYPKDAHYVVTTMFDECGSVVQWYIDICKKQGITEQQVPWFEDLYLDIVIFPDNKFVLLDEDELLAALEQGKVTEKDADLASRTVKQLLRDIKHNRFPYFDLSRKHYKQFVIDMKR